MGIAGQDSSVTADPDCPFCAIVERDDPDVREVYRDDQVVAFFPTEPAILGHTLIVPRTHVPLIWELDDEHAEHIGLLVSRMSRVIVNTLGSEGLSVIQSNGEVATQSVNHVHVHLVPRWKDDAIGRIWPPETNYSENDKDNAWDELRDACRELRIEGKRDLPKIESTSETVRLKHLDYVQSIVARMAKSSTQAKSWLLPVAVATFGYALTQRSGTVALLGVAAILLFGYMDASYLRQERVYRLLYHEVVAGKGVPELSLDPHDIDRKIPDADGEPSPNEDPKKEMGIFGKLHTAVRGWFFFDPRVWFSWSIFPFYGGFLAVGIAVFWYAFTH